MASKPWEIELDEAAPGYTCQSTYGDSTCDRPVDHQGPHIDETTHASWSDADAD